MTAPIESEIDDPRVVRAAREYLAELEAGRVPDRKAILAAHPNLAHELNECFDGIELAHGAGKALGVAPAPPQIAGTIGDFRIVREIGRGGMGVVYEAQQTSLDRRVALKVLPFAAALDAKQLRRFRTEAHAAAQLHHTNIVPVHAVGSDRGVHYYAMQLIEGRPLDAVIRELRGDADPVIGGTTIDLLGASTAGGPTANSANRSGRGRQHYRLAARLALQVADALAYAHEAGVIHRDIKPGNLIVDSKGTVWVTDFGLAQVSAEVSLTQTGDVFGTIRYMSPEQASGLRVLIDQRTDVYSLGATLYELLTLEPIFAARDRRALLHQVLNEDPKPLRQIDRGIPVELETIVLKAVAKLPADRYASAADMAADLRRFLEDRPITARRPTVLERSRKWIRRHPTGVGAAALLLALTVIGMGTGMALLAREQDKTKDALSREAATNDQLVREQTRTQTALDAEKHQAAETDLRFQLARRTADELIRMAEEELSDRPELRSLRKRLLERALQYYQEFIELRRSDSSAVAELATTRDRIKQIIDDLSILEGAGQIALLQENGVLDDLKLTVDQRNALPDFWRRQGERRDQMFHRFRDLTEEERRQFFLEMARADEADLGSILSTTQIKRLDQISNQWKGLSAFRELGIIGALKLSVDQRDQIRALESGVFAPVGHQSSPPLGGTARKDWDRKEQERKDRERREQEKKLRDAVRVIETEILSMDQLRIWRELIGEPMKGGIPFRPRASGDRKGPPGGGGPTNWPKQ
jgi:serine/threonine protein kinase